MGAVPASCREVPQKATVKAATATVLPTPFRIVLPTVTVETNSEVFARKKNVVCCFQDRISVSLTVLDLAM